MRFPSSRQGRGESKASAPFTLDRELADLAALIDVAGGQATLYDSSSDSAICLAAAASGLPVTRLALWEAPLGAESGNEGAESCSARGPCSPRVISDEPSSTT